MIIFFLALNVLLPRIRRHGSNQVILGLSVMLFLCCVAHFALEFNHFHFTLVRRSRISPVVNASHQTLTLHRERLALTASRMRRTCTLRPTSSFPSPTSSETSF